MLAFHWFAPLGGIAIVQRAGKGPRAVLFVVSLINVVVMYGGAVIIMVIKVIFSVLKNTKITFLYC